MSELATPALISATDLNEVVSSYLNEEDTKRVYDAFLLAADAHDGVVRKSGEFYIFHPLYVAYVLADLRMDADTLCAALLHDVIEDTDYSKQDIIQQFGSVVADLVDGVTKLAGGEFTSRQEANAASFHKMITAMTQDYRVVLIKLADRLHNVKTLGVRKPEARRRIAQETLDIHVPLARRMGMNALRKQLQLSAFQHLYPWRASVLEKAMRKHSDEWAKIHNKIVKTLTDGLNDKQLNAVVFPWQNNIYRLYSRIKNTRGRKQLNLSSEALPIRVLVKSTKDCYAALGVVHQIFPPKVGSFQDFIAIPKGYGFQALQTILMTPQRQLVKVQIQSREMHKIAQYGITAHLRYPELLSSSNKSQLYLQNWLKQVEELQQIESSPAEFLEDMKADLFLNEIYLSTPKGETKVFPKDSTPVDFAYAIHTEVGNQCVGATLDGEPCQLDIRLPNGATVEIITSEDATPQPSWLNFLITAKARSSVRNWISKRKKHEFISLGKQLLNKALMPYNEELDSIFTENMEKTLKTLGMSDEDALFTSIAKGAQSAKIVARRLLGNITLPLVTEEDEKELFIKGTEGLVVALQSCCHPIPGDNIVAQFDEIKGLKVHRSECPTLVDVRSLQKNKAVHSIAWLDGITEHEIFLSPLIVQVRNRVGVLSHITDLLEELRVNIEEINISGDKEVKDMYFLLQVENKEHLQKIAESIHNQSHVLNVIRPF